MAYDSSLCVDFMIQAKPFSGGKRNQEKKTIVRSLIIAICHHHMFGCCCCGDKETFSSSPSWGRAGRGNQTTQYFGKRIMMILIIVFFSLSSPLFCYINVWSLPQHKKATEASGGRGNGVVIFLVVLFYWSLIDDLCLNAELRAVFSCCPRGLWIICGVFFVVLCTALQESLRLESR